MRIVAGKAMQTSATEEDIDASLKPAPQDQGINHELQSLADEYGVEINEEDLDE